MKEIERKYLVNKVPELKKYRYIEIEQAYLNISPDPIIRIRKYNDDYFLTYKSSTNEEKLKSCNICTEYELPLSKDAYYNLKEKKEGNIIKKRRYLIPLNESLIAELDVFMDNLEGLIEVEVEFQNEKTAKEFNKPSWFGKEVTKDKRYINSSLAKLESIKNLI